MPAEVRSIVQNAIAGGSGQVLRGEARQGDTLLAFHAADIGDLAAMSIAGGWQPLTVLAGEGWAGTKVWARTAAGSEPETYAVAQDADGDGTVIILAVKGATRVGVVVEVSAANSVAPAATPAGASGLEIRYAAAAADGVTVSWTPLPGYDGLDVQSNTYTTAMIAVRPYASSNPVPAVALNASPRPPARHAITVLLPSAGSGPTPTPTPFPPYTPARGLSLARYTAHDMLTGEFRGDLDTISVDSYDRRLGDQGSFSGSIALPSRREADRIREIIPEDETDLSSGPGRTVIHCWRDDQLTGVYWLHTAVEQRDARSGVSLRLQGVTLDGYLNHVALAEAINLDEGDQIANARALLQLVMDTPGSNLGLTMQAGLSGVDRPLTAEADAFVGQTLATYSRVEGGFEHVINPRVASGALLRSWEWGSPKIDHPDAVHEFVEADAGGTIVSWSRTISALSGHTRLAVIGGTPQQEDVTTTAVPVRSPLLTASAHLAAGWPIIDKRLRHDSTDQSTIDDYAAYWASRTAGSPRVFECTVLLGKSSSWDPNGLGDYARIILNNPRYPIRDGRNSFDKTMRIIGWSLRPAKRGQGRDQLTLVLEQEVI